MPLYPGWCSYPRAKDAWRDLSFDRQCPAAGWASVIYLIRPSKPRISLFVASAFKAVVKGKSLPKSERRDECSREKKNRERALAENTPLASNLA